MKESGTEAKGAFPTGLGATIYTYTKRSMRHPYIRHLPTTVGRSRNGLQVCRNTHGIPLIKIPFWTMAPQRNETVRRKVSYTTRESTPNNSKTTT